MARWLVLVAIAGCYSPPRPACGFVCGEGGACQTGYTCSAVDNRCHLDGTSSDCESFVDAALPDGPDTTPPIVIAKSPDDGTTNVALDATVSATFSEAVTGFDAMTGFRLDWSGGFLTGTAMSEGTVPFAVKYMTDFPFPGSTAITATLTPMVSDAAGNPLAMTTWTFTTVPDPVAPTVTSTTPANGDTAVSVDTAIEVLFDKPIVLVQTAIAVDHGVTGTITSAGPLGLKLTPSAALAPATTYNATVTTDVTDRSGNHLAAPVLFSFTTR